MWESAVKYVMWRWSDKFYTIYCKYPVTRETLTYLSFAEALTADNSAAPDCPTTTLRFLLRLTIFFRDVVSHMSSRLGWTHSTTSQNQTADRAEGNTHTGCFIAVRRTANQTPLKDNLRLYKGYVLRKHRPFLIITSVQRWEVCAGICSFLLELDQQSQQQAAGLRGAFSR